MATTWKLYHDSALTNPVESGDTAAFTAIAGGGDDLQLWYGSTNPDVQIQATSDPGVDPITLTPVAYGSGQPTSSIKLALSQAGLASATGGAALTVGTTLTSGSANAVSVWVRWTASGTTADSYTGISIDSNDVTETPV